MYICIHVYSYIHKYIYYKNKYILSDYHLLKYTEYNSLCYTVGPFCLPILYIAIFICFSQILNLSLPHPLSLLVTLSLFSISVSLLLS